MAAEWDCAVKAIFLDGATSGCWDIFSGEVQRVQGDLCSSSASPHGKSSATAFSESRQQESALRARLKDHCVGLLEYLRTSSNHLPLG